MHVNILSDIMVLNQIVDQQLANWSLPKQLTACFTSCLKHIFILKLEIKMTWIKFRMNVIHNILNVKF